MIQKILIIIFAVILIRIVYKAIYNTIVSWHSYKYYYDKVIKIKGVKSIDFKFLPGIFYFEVIVEDNDVSLKEEIAKVDFEMYEKFKNQHFKFHVKDKK